MKIYHIKVLIRVRESSHTAHNSQHVIIGSIHANSRAQVRANRVVRHGKKQRGVVNSRQVARATWLMLLWLQSKRVHVNTNSRDVGVVLVRLHPIEVVTITHLESVVTVKLQQGSNGRVFTSHTFHASDGVTRLQHGAVPPV